MRPWPATKPCSRRRFPAPPSPTASFVALLFLLVGTPAAVWAGPQYSLRVVQTRSGVVRGVILHLNSRRLAPVEVFRGVPYAAAPVGELRLAPPQPAPPWNGTRLADSYGPVCPQRTPDMNNRTAAQQAMPRGRYLHLRKLLPLLQRQSEDCLSLNLFVPGSGSRGVEAPYAVIVLIHGESYEWNAGSPYDGSVLASWNHVIVITFNYRLGILGFIRVRPEAESVRLSGAEAAEDALDVGVQDVLAALRWVQANVAAFGGDPGRVLLLGHDTGAAIASLLLLSPAAKGLFHNVLLLSGSALSPWAVVQTPSEQRTVVAEQLGCLAALRVNGSAPNAGDVNLAPCLRRLPLDALLSVQIQAPRFLPSFGPAEPLGVARERLGLGSGRFGFGIAPPDAPFAHVSLMIGAATTESYLDFNNQDIMVGFEEEQRNRILRTFVRNAYVFHLNEIFSTIRNEYTDWERPVSHPINLRDNTLEALSDGHTVAPLLHLARRHAAKVDSPNQNPATYFFHFGHQTRDSAYPQRLGSVRGEPLPYILGHPLVPGESLYPLNFTRQDISVAENIVNFIANFAKTGNPNGHGARTERDHSDNEGREARQRIKDLTWEPYNANTQLYLSMTQKPRMKSHYRGHRMAVWLELIPQLHRAGGADVGMRHHHFHEKGDRYFTGSVRTESFTQFPAVVVPPASTTATPPECTPANNATVPLGGDSPASAVAVAPPVGQSTMSSHPSTEAEPDNSNDNFLQTMTAGHFFSSSLALGATLGAGGLLLFLNVLVLGAILYQRARRAQRRRKRNTATAGGAERGDAEGGTSCDRAEVAGTTCVAAIAGPRAKHKQVSGPPRYSSAVPVPPPPPPPPPPRAMCATASTSTLPRPGGTIKKRVQIQEISV